MSIVFPEIVGSKRRSAELCINLKW